MRVDQIELFHVALPLRQAAPTPLGPREKLETILVAMHGEGATGWGEASPGICPRASSEWACGVFALLRDWLCPAVVGATLSSGEDLTKRLEPFRGNQHAKAAIDMAWWDLHARLQGRPLHEVLLTGANAAANDGAVEVGATYDQMETIDQLIAAIADAVEKGCSRVKLKFRPGWDVRMVDFVRKEFPVLSLGIDCEGGLNLGQTDMLYRLEDFSLTTIEQPLPADDLVGHAMVQQSLRTPICLDESITTLTQAEMAIELQSCKAMNLKPGRVGGLTPALAIHDLCQEASIPCYVGAMPQTTVAARHGLSLAAGKNCTDPADFIPYDQLFVEDIAEPLVAVKSESDGRLRVQLWSAPGIGVEPDRARAEARSIARATIPA